MYGGDVLMAEVYGTSFIETASDKLITELTALKSTMASGYSPTFSYLYQKHDTANLQLNAVSVDLESIEADYEGGIPNGPRVRYMMTFSVRVHTAYSGGVMDGQTNHRLLNSVANKLMGNLDLASGYRIMGITEIVNREAFDDSATLGGHLNVVVMYVVSHSQE